MKKLCILIFVLFTIWHFPINGYGQSVTDSIQTHIETSDGNEYIGTIINQDEESIRLHTEQLGTINIKRVNIKSIKEVQPKEIQEGTYWPENFQSTRYFWCPNAYNLKKGEGYYQNVWILFNQFTTGVTDYFSVGGGFVPLFLFGGGATPAWATIKYSVPVITDKLNIGAGALFGSIFGEKESFGILYGIVTIGSKDKNLNIGMGWAYSNGEKSDRPTINISGQVRISAKSYLITENYFIGGGNNYSVGIISFGGRQIIKKIGLDYGLFMPFGEEIDEFVAVPWLGITVPLGKN